jgi:hypothetical protein
MSVGGANLEVEREIGIPFDRVIEAEHSNHHCLVVLAEGTPDRRCI